MAMEADNPLTKKLLEFFECPVCTDYMFPPIRQCLAGHSCCNRCFDIITMCFYCKGPKSGGTRNYSLESIQSQLTFPCKNQTDGCDVNAVGVSIKEHEKYCRYSTKLCPLMNTDYCLWAGRRIESIRHIREAHGSYVSLQNITKLITRSFGDYHRQRRCSFIFAVFNEVFRFTLEINSRTRITRYAVYNISRPMEDAFSYQITFHDGNSNMNAITSGAICAYCDAEPGNFHSSVYLMASYDMLRALRDNNGDLHYTVKIFLNDGLQPPAIDHEPGDGDFNAEMLLREGDETEPMNNGGHYTYDEAFMFYIDENHNHVEQPRRP